MKPKLTVTADFTENFKEIISSFKRDEVLVGIPEEKSDRKVKKGEEPEGVNNATLLAINNFGLASKGIPPRPVMAIGIRNAQKPIAEEFRKACVEALSNGKNAVEKYYRRAGIIASTAVKIAINDQEGILPPSKATIDAREAAGFKGTKALIVTGQMRSAITYVLKKDA